MRKSLSLWVIVAALITLPAASAQAGPLVVTTGLTAQQLVDLLVAANPGITVLSATYTGDAIASGSFTAGTPVLPFNEGVIMTSGNANFAENNDNTQDGATLNNAGVDGDPDLQSVSGFSIFDAAILEFTFTAVNPVISFQYAFASEEYNEFVGGSVNDSFGFFLNGNNIALIPGSSDPITINDVNCGSNAQYYTNNDNSTPNGGGDAVCVNAGKPNANLPFEYDGLVGASSNPALWLFATGTVLTGGQVNTIKLAIGDAGDSVLDSAVFLKAGSFTNEPPPPPPVPEPASLALLGLALAGFGARRRMRARQTA